MTEDEFRKKTPAEKKVALTILQRIPLTLGDLAGVATSEVQKINGQQLQVTIVVTLKEHMTKQIGELACGGAELFEGGNDADIHRN